MKKTTDGNKVLMRETRTAVKKILCFMMVLLLVFSFNGSAFTGQTQYYSGLVIADNFNQWQYFDGDVESNFVVEYYFGWDEGFLEGLYASFCDEPIESFAFWDYALGDRPQIVFCDEPIESFVFWDPNLEVETVDQFLNTVTEHYFCWSLWEPDYEDYVIDDNIEPVESFAFWDPNLEVDDEICDIVIEYYFCWSLGLGDTSPGVLCDKVIEYYFCWSLGLGDPNPNDMVNEYYFGWEDFDFSIEALGYISDVVVEYYFGFDYGFIDDGPDYFCDIVVEYYFGWDAGTKYEAQAYYSDYIVESYIFWDPYFQCEYEIFYLIDPYNAGVYFDAFNVATLTLSGNVWNPSSAANFTAVTVTSNRTWTVNRNVT